MQFSSLLAFTLAAVSVSAIPVRRDVDPGLVIDFGINRNVNPTGTGDCDGFNGIKIPCSCPPSAADYLASLNANVAKGFDVNNPGVPAPFPTGNSQQDRIIRLQTQISSLQNLFGPGKGCPAAATNWNPILADLIAGKSPATNAIGGGSAPPPAAPAPPPPPPAAPAPAPAAGGVDPALVIDFGINRNVNPTGTGDCDGFNGVKIPCSCPPSASDYLASLSANVAKGFDVNNPGVPAPFPTGNSQQDRIIRLQTQISSLQNLFGPGKGCPAAATNWNPILADLIAGKSPATKAIGGSAPASATPAAAPAPPAAAPAPAGGVDPALVLQFGVTPNTNPTGTGDCDGLNGIKIPCSCPPSRDFFIQSLSANVAAGKQVNNPGLGAPFPTDGSVKSQVIRLQTQISSLQNLFGPGKGCPAAATNWNGILADLISRQ